MRAPASPHGHLVLDALDRTDLLWFGRNRSARTRTRKVRPAEAAYVRETFGFAPQRVVITRSARSVLIREYDGRIGVVAALSTQLVNEVGA